MIVSFLFFLSAFYFAFGVLYLVFSFIMIAHEFRILNIHDYVQFFNYNSKKSLTSYIYG